jgi:hypothetical protein
MLVQELDLQLVRPPVVIRRAAAGGVVERAFGFGGHIFIDWMVELNSVKALSVFDTTAMAVNSWPHPESAAGGQGTLIVGDRRAGRDGELGCRVFLFAHDVCRLN